MEISNYKHALTSYMGFDSFDEEAWHSWLEQALLGHFELFGSYRDEEIHETLVRLFKGLSASQRRNFSSTIATLIQSTPILQSNAERFFYLFQVAQVVKPRGSKLIIRKLLADGIGQIEFEQKGSRRQLQGSLLSAAAKYDVDDWLRDYIWASAAEYSNFEYALLCMRILSWRLDDSCFKFHQILIGRLADQWHIEQYRRQLFAVIRRVKCRLFLLWYQSFYPQKANKVPRDALIKWSEVTESVLLQFPQDPYAKLMLAELRAEKGKLRSQEFLEIVNLYNDAAGEIVIQTLVRLHENYAWELVLPEDPAASAFRGPYRLNLPGFSTTFDPELPDTKVLDQAYIRILEKETGVAPDHEADVEYR
jgi:hypothetical protein